MNLHTHIHAQEPTHIYVYICVQKSKHVTNLSLGFLIPEEPSTSTKPILKLNIIFKHS